MVKLKKKDSCRKVLITGATGASGPALVGLLLENGYSVRIFSRHCSGFSGLPEEVERFQGDIRDPLAVAGALQGVDAVCHLAAILHDRGQRSSEKEMMHTNVGGTKILVDGARRAGVGRFVFFSTINVYGPSLDNQLFTETSPVQPQDSYARSKLEAERIVLGEVMDSIPADGFSPVVLRGATVYGPNMKGNYKALMRYLKIGGFALLGEGFNVRTLVFDRDLALAALICLEHPKCHGQIYNVTDGEVHSFNDIVLSMCRTLGRKPPFIKIPHGKVIYILHTLNRIFPSILFVKLSRMAEKQVEGLGVSGEKLQTELGFTPDIVF